jgi:hypothetical protein
MPRRIDMRHDVNRPASRPRLVGGFRRVGRTAGSKAAADAGIGTEQCDLAELTFGLLDDVKDVFLLSDIAFEGRPADRRGDGARATGIDIGDHHLGGAGAMKGLAHRLPDAVGATGDNHDFAGHLHGRSSRFL